jgi:acetyltransferase
MNDTSSSLKATVEPAPVLGTVTIVLGDGMFVVLRPLRPDDLPLLEKLLGSCSSRTLYSRFHYITKRTHELASKFCNIEARREKVIVAEIESGGERTLIGLCELAADPRHRSAEVAILIADRWQGKGLGGLLADHSIDAARQWGVREVVAVTTPDNRQVITMARQRRFRIFCQWEDRTMVLSRRFHRKRKKLLGNAA